MQYLLNDLIKLPLQDRLLVIDKVLHYMLSSSDLDATTLGIIQSKLKSILDISNK
jgi:hypothetical protein